MLFTHTKIHPLSASFGGWWVRLWDSLSANGETCTRHSHHRQHPHCRVGIRPIPSISLGVTPGKFSPHFAAALPVCLLLSGSSLFYRLHARRVQVFFFQDDFYTFTVNSSFLRLTAAGGHIIHLNFLCSRDSVALPLLFQLITARAMESTVPCHLSFYFAKSAFPLRYVQKWKFAGWR